MIKKGIILAGGSGSRLRPSTIGISKQLIPVYDKPMIFYPLSTLIYSGIEEVLIISTSNYLNLFKNLLEDGSSLGIKIEYMIQDKPNGLAEAFIIGEKFIDNNPCCLILGDNIFQGGNLQSFDKNDNFRLDGGAQIFAYAVSDPNRYGVIEFDNDLKAISIEEKPTFPKSSYAVTGLYLYDKDVVRYAKSLKPSIRNELEITDLNNIYIKNNSMEVNILGEDIQWFDTGTHDSLLEASSFIKAIQKRKGKIDFCPDEISFRMGLINRKQLIKNISSYEGSEYGKYLKKLLDEH
tara:strand:- start:1155 stop:2033 length:879 start_codon:yes stop_codon:yes gene_type:complete